MSDRGDSTRARLIRAGDAPLTELRYGRGTMLRLVGPAIGARAVDLHLNTIRAGSAPGPYHLHTGSENVYYVLSGQVRIRIDGVDHDASPGDAVFIPPGVPHSATNAGEEDARLLEIYAPAEVDFVEVPDSPGGA
ncbi:MAG TPA: cupin domain-containing protein [Candidatus Limnocylindria bacterium]|nr:cupin domain-containing protein [Candidatus Limnocylindria bacterium]